MWTAPDESGKLKMLAIKDSLAVNDIYYSIQMWSCQRDEVFSCIYMAESDNKGAGEGVKYIVALS